MTTTTHDELLSAITKQRHIATAASELETARQFIRQVTISGFALRNAGLSAEAADELLRSLREVERAISNASYATDSLHRSAQAKVVDLVEGLSK